MVSVPGPLAHAPRISGALAAIAAAVVGVIAALLVQFVAAILLRTSLALHWVLALCAIAGVVSSTKIFSAFL